MEKKETNNLLFVYGTLRKGGGNDGAFFNKKNKEHFEWIGKGKTVEKYVLAVNGIPFVSDVPVDSGSFSKRANIIGDLLSISDDMLSNIDYFEGHPYGYKRKLTHVLADTGEEFEAWLYFYQLVDNDMTRMKVYESGDYFNKYV